VTTRREFLLTTAGALTTFAVAAQETAPEPIIDIHQHTNYSGRTNAQLIAHQKAMGVTHTILLPAGRLYGLDAQCGGNQSVVDLAKEHPGQYWYFANEITDHEEAVSEVRKYLKQGAIGIGEQKFQVACDSPALHRIAELAKEFAVPVLMHFQHERYNTSIENFHKTLEKFPTVNFIGHAQTWWGNVDKNHEQKTMYPKGPVTRGGITERLLSDYPNMFGDLSAGSGLNFLNRDEEHTRWFLEKYQDKLLFGSDCNDVFGRGPGCQGANTIAAIRRFAATKKIERKLLFENAKRLLKLP
jgi:predicted TIM-barrel fold metal-dependent hydrolase